jgi:D-glycero-alpha-D-manno-heptose-7-phosphate kinase
MSFGGGGTDLPSHYQKEGGFVVSAAIDKYIYMLVTTGYQSRFRLKHLEWEEAEHHDDITHPILRECLTRHWNGSPVEIASVADAPPGTGLGSSGAYTVCALRALHALDGDDPAPPRLAELASEIELDALERTVGKQDQYVSAHGGVCAMTFNPDESVEVRRLELGRQTLAEIAERFLLFFTGGARSASDMFAHQVSRTLAGDVEMVGNLRRTEEIARETCAALEAGDLDRCGELMNEQWGVKRSRAPGMVTERIEELRELALGAGAEGVTLMGAGGGGFLLAYAPQPDAPRDALEAAGAPELPFRIEAEGCTASTYG